MTRSNHPSTFEGFLGSDPEPRFTKEVTKQVMVSTEFRTNWKLDQDQLEDVMDVTTLSRDYLCLSLAVQERIGGSWKTRWIQLRIWDPYATRDWFQARISRKGDKVRATGVWRFHTYTDASGTERTFEYLELTAFAWIERKAHRELDRQLLRPRSR